MNKTFWLFLLAMIGVGYWLLKDGLGGGGGSVLELSESTFESRVLGNSQPAMVEFWAPW